MQATTTDDERGTGFVVSGVVAGYSFPYCTHNVLNEFKDLYPVRIDLAAGQLVEVHFTAFARGEFTYSLVANPPCSAEELMDSLRALKTPWQDVQPGAVDSGPWYPMSTTTVFKIGEKATYAFSPRLAKSVFSGKYAVHHQNIVARVLPEGDIKVFEGEWPV